MPTTIAPVQLAGTTQVITPSPASGTLTDTQAFTGNNTAGNSILVAVWGYNFGDGFCHIGNYQVSDTQGNIYTRILNVAAGGIAVGPGVGLFLATNIKAGANTVTGSFDWTRDVNAGEDFNQGLMIAEYAMPTPVVQDVQYYQIYGASGIDPVTVNITDSHSATVGVTFSTSAAPFGPGSASSAVVLDLLTDGVDYLIAITFGNDNDLMVAPVTSPAGYVTFVNQLNVGPLVGAGQTQYGHWYDPGSITLTLTIAASTLQIGALCSGYFQLSAVYATGGTPPYSFSITAGALPPGLTLDSTTGSISGTTQDQPGVYNFTATVTDSTSATASIPLSITIEDVYGVTDPQIILQISNDGGKTWGPERSTSLGKIGEYNTLVRWRAPNGRSNNRAIRVICSEPVDVALLAMDLDVSS